MKTNKEKTRGCAIAASSLSSIAFIIYNWKAFSDNNHPNISSWTLWTFLTVLNFTSYNDMTGDWIKTLLPIVDTFLCAMTASLAFIFGSVQNLSVTEWLCFFMGSVAGIVWFAFKSNKKGSTYAQIILQIGLWLGFIPTLQAEWRHQSNEPWIAWLLWVICFIFQFQAVRYTWRGKYIDFAYPVINGLIMHSAVFVLAVT